MKIVILAAGKGARFGGNEQPKPLICLADGKSILQHQIEALEKFFSRHDIWLVVGYHKELLMEAYDDLLFVYNPHFDKENTSKSLLRAIKKIHEDLLWINGDVLFHPEILEELLAMEKNCMAVTLGKVGDEEVKYKSLSNGKIIEVSKTVKEAQGEAIGINLFKASSVPRLLKALESCQDNDFFERGVEACISEGMDVWCCPVDKSLCIEIDFPEDLAHANQILHKWK